MDVSGRGCAGLAGILFEVENIPDETKAIALLTSDIHFIASDGTVLWDILIGRAASERPYYDSNRLKESQEEPVRHFCV